MKKIVLLFCLVCGALLLPGARTAAATTVTGEEIRPALEQLLREHPEIMLNFLRQHSQTVLDIAQKGSTERRIKNLEAQWAKDAETPKTMALDNRPCVGPRDSKVKIVAFSDFTCQYCQKAEKVVQEVLKEYAGKVCFIFKNMPLEVKGISGIASQYFVAIGMQDEAKAWDFYRAMFENRDKLMAEGENFIRSTAASLGVDMKKLDSQRKKRAVSAIIDEDIKDADKLHVEGTPYFLVNNLVIRGAVPKDVFRKAIEMELNK